MIKEIKFYTGFLSFILLTVSLNCYAQLKYEHYNDSDGLSHNSVRHIVQDNHGFIWLGTFSGLNRFDGYQFRQYLSSSSDENKILNDDITALHLDKQSNNLWIGTRKGLTLLDIDTQNFTTFLPENNNPYSLPDQEIRSVYVDKFKRVWVGTKSSGLFILDPNTQRFTKVNLENFFYIKGIFEDSQGNIWIGSYDTASLAKISMNDDGVISEITQYELGIPNSKAKNPYLNFIYEDGKSDIFIGTREGLYKLDKSSNTFISLFIKDKVVRDKLGPYFLSIARAPNGKYWIGTLGGLLVCDSLEDIPKGNYQWHYSVISDSSSLADNLISALYFDASGVLWIGTNDGLDKYDPYENQFKINKDISKYIDNQAPNIRGFSKTYKGEVIVATRHNGLFISKNDTFIPLYDNNSDIASIYSKDGIIFYCGLWNGNILVYNYKNSTSKTINVGFEMAPVFSFVELDNSLIICSFGEGAVFVNSKTFEFENKILPNYEINKVVLDLENNLWFATEKGLAKHNLKNDQTIYYNHDINNPNGLPHNNVSDVIVSPSGKIWASTRMGLGIYQPQTNNFKNVEVPKELSSKWVTHMVVDTHGDLWLNMNNNSIGKYNFDAQSINIYPVKSGNRLDVFSSSGFYNLESSNIYLGGKNGVIYFSPYEIKDNKLSPKPVITEFKVNNKQVLPRLKLNNQIPLKKDINYSKQVELSYANRNFSLQFSTPSFTNPRLNKFQYMLEGFDRDWIETNSESRTVQYTNLDASTYNFKIRSSNSSGIWSEAVSYEIKILPSFWMSYKGIALILCLIAFIFYFIWKQVKVRLKLKNELLTEKIKRERDEKLNNEKLRFFTNISHELRTPLTLILGPAKQLLNETYQNQNAKNKITLIHQNANRLLRLVNQILDFRRAETGELKLKVSEVDVLKITKSIFYSFVELAQSKNINFNFNAEDEKIVCWVDFDKLNKILYNLLSNAVKFTNNHGNVDLFIGLKDNKTEKLIIEVSDDGIGIPLESQEKIFSRFYQANNSKSNTTGTGIGLSLVKALVEIHKGEIKVESEPNQGSVFTVELPINKNAYNSEEIQELDIENSQKSLEEIISQVPRALEQTRSHKVIFNTDIKHEVLVIEDNPELRKYIVDYLSDFYKVYEAENGKEGLAICKNIKPVLCVVDVMMPVMDGFKFVEAIKNDENLSHTAVILLTALAENENRIKGYKVGVDGYLVKPFDPALLKSRIENVIKIRFDLKQKFSGEAESDIMTLAHSQIDIDLISKIKKIIESNINLPELTSSFISTEMAMSTSKLYRKIKELTNLSPNEFIRTIRLKKSAELLKSKKYNVSEVSDLVGFNDPLYFSRVFKKQFGYSPSELLK